jgi:3-isopropylmalate/(R)-2-methylmalate dehydratase small subunit
MEPFRKLSSPAVPLDASSVDTDQIIPARFLCMPRHVLGRHKFHDLRFDESGVPTDVPFNEWAYRGARILVARDNFGCGSSREAAVWALMGRSSAAELDMTHSYRCIIAPSFGEIFFHNAWRNGLLLVRLPAPAVSALLGHLRDYPGTAITVDLQAQTVVGPGDMTRPFDLDAFQKACLLQGRDEIEITTAYGAEIDAFERRRATEVPWVVTGSGLDEDCHLR